MPFTPFDELSRSVLADVAQAVAGVDATRAAALADAIARDRRVFLIGTGRSGAMLHAMSIRLGHLGIDAHLASAADYPSLGNGDLVLIASGSGTTPVPLVRAQTAAEAGATLVVLTAAPSSPIAQLAGTVLHIPAPVTPTDPSPHTLRSLFEESLLIVCDLLCRMVKERLGVTTDDMQARHSPTE